MTTWTPEELMRLGIIKHSADFIRGILKGEDKNYYNNPILKGGDIQFKNITYDKLIFLLIIFIIKFTIYSC